MVETRKTSGVLEAVVTAAILLVLVQTFVEDLAIVTGGGESLRSIMLFTGLFFDLFFTVEFLVRLYNALLRRRAMHYIVHERGWIDFLASIPLLTLSSGPPAIAFLLEGATFAGFGGILNMLKLIKAIRIARILRLLRIIKIFRSIKYADSPMAQRHIAKIITTSITAIVFSLFFFSTFSDWVQAGPDAGYRLREKKIVALIKDAREADPELIRGIHLIADTVVLVKKDGETVYSRYDGAYLKKHFATGGYSLVSDDGVEVFFDRREENELVEKSSAWQTLFFFCIVMLIVVSYLVVYSPHFAITVTDPIHVMRRGFGEKDYNLEVKIHPIYGGDDIYVLARLYNEEFLPLKDRSRESEEAAGTELKLDDIQDILD